MNCGGFLSPGSDNDQDEQELWAVKKTAQALKWMLYPWYDKKYSLLLACVHV